MKRLITKSRGLILAGALGLSVLGLAACGSGDSTNPAPGAAAQGTASGLATLLNSTSGAAAYEQLLQGTGGGGSNQVSGIWVNGQGEASAVPDLAILNLGVDAFASTVAEARTDGATAMGQVLDVLAENGVADRDVQTRFFNINARYTSHEVTRCTTPGDTIEPDGPEQNVQPQGSTGIPEPEPEVLTPVMPVPPNIEPGDSPTSVVVEMELDADDIRRKQECVTERERALLGYDVNNQLSVKIRDLSAIGEVIDAVTDAGGGLIRFQGVSFTIEDDKALKEQARAAAVEDIMAKADQVGALTGVALGELVYIAESGGSVFTQSIRSEGIAFASAAPPTPIQLGEMQVSVNLQAAFDINPSDN